MNLSNYPPGVTGNEPEIVGDTAWEALFERIGEDSTKEGFTDVEARLAWMLGLNSLKAVRAIGGRFHTDTEPLPPLIEQSLGDERDELRHALAWLVDCAADLGADQIQLADARRALEKSEH